MLIATDGIVLKTKTVGNDDHILTLLTREKGIITAFARNQQRISRGMSSAFEPFTYSNFVLFHSKERYTINSAISSKIFLGIRNDIEKLSLVSYFAELLIELAPEEGENAEEYLRLFLNCLAMLENDRRSIYFIKPLFELRIISMAGYMPDLIACTNCGQAEGKSISFIPNEGSLVCEECRIKLNPKSVFPLQPSELAAMRHIIYSPMQKLFSFSVPEQMLKNLSSITENYISIQLEKNFSTLEFYHSILKSFDRLTKGQ